MDEDLRSITKKLAEANLVASAMVLRHEERIKEHEEWLRQIVDCQASGVSGAA